MLALPLLAFGAAAPSPVADAAMKGDIAAVRTLIQQKSDVNAQQPTARPQCNGPPIATIWRWPIYDRRGSQRQDRESRGRDSAVSRASMEGNSR